MTAVIDCFHTPISGYAHLGAPRLMEIARTAGARVRFRSMDIAAVFEAGATALPPAQPPARLADRLADLAREAERTGLPIHPRSPHRPAPSAPAGQLVFTAEAEGIDPHRVSVAVMTALYALARRLTHMTE